MSIMDDEHEFRYKQFNSEFTNQFVADMNELLDDTKSPFLKIGMEPARREKRDEVKFRLEQEYQNELNNPERAEEPIKPTEEIINRAIDSSVPLGAPENYLGDENDPASGASDAELLQQIKLHLKLASHSLPERGILDSRGQESHLASSIDLREMNLNCVFRYRQKIESRMDAYFNQEPAPDYTKDQDQYRFYENLRGIFKRFDSLLAAVDPNHIDYIDIKKEKNEFDAARADLEAKQVQLKEIAEDIQKQNIKINLGNIENKNPAEDKIVTQDDILNDFSLSTSAGIDKMRNALDDAAKRLNSEKKKTDEQLTKDEWAEVKVVRDSYDGKLKQLREENKRYSEELAKLDKSLKNKEKFEDMPQYHDFVAAADVFKLRKDAFKGIIDESLFNYKPEEHFDALLKEEDLKYYDDKLKQVNDRIERLNNSLASQEKNTEEAVKAAEKSEKNENLDSEIENAISTAQFENAEAAGLIRLILDEHGEHPNKKFDINDSNLFNEAAFCTDDLRAMRSAAIKTYSNIEEASRKFGDVLTKRTFGLGNNASAAVSAMNGFFDSEKSLDDAVSKFKTKANDENALPWKKGEAENATPVSKNDIEEFENLLKEKPLNLDKLADRTNKLDENIARYREGIAEKLANMNENTDAVKKKLIACDEKAQKLQTKLAPFVAQARELNIINKSYAAVMNKMFGEMATTRLELLNSINNDEKKRENVKNMNQEQKQQEKNQITEQLIKEKEERINKQNQTNYELTFLNEVKDVLEKGKKWCQTKMNDSRFKEKARFDICKKKVDELNAAIDKAEKDKNTKMDGIHNSYAIKKQTVQEAFAQKAAALNEQNLALTRFVTVAGPLARKLKEVEGAARKFGEKRENFINNVEQGKDRIGIVKANTMEKFDEADKATILELLKTKKVGMDSSYFREIKTALKEYMDAQQLAKNGELSKERWEQRSNRLINALTVYEQERDTGFEKKKTYSGQRRIDLVKQLKNSLLERKKNFDTFDSIEKSFRNTAAAYAEPKSYIEGKFLTQPSLNIKNTFDPNKIEQQVAALHNVKQHNQVENNQPQQVLGGMQ